LLVRDRRGKGVCVCVAQGYSQRAHTNSYTRDGKALDCDDYIRSPVVVTMLSFIIQPLTYEHIPPSHPIIPLCCIFHLTTPRGESNVRSRRVLQYSPSYLRVLRNALGVFVCVLSWYRHTILGSVPGPAVCRFLRIRVQFPDLHPSTGRTPRCFALPVPLPGLDTVCGLLLLLLLHHRNFPTSRWPFRSQQPHPYVALRSLSLSLSFSLSRYLVLLTATSFEILCARFRYRR